VPLLSICIPTHNRADWLKACLDSCLAQVDDVADGLVEVVVSDNVSTDRTPGLLAEYASRHPALRVNTNPYNNYCRNFDTVVQFARGEYAWLLGDDDALLPGAVARVVQLLQDQPRDLYLPHVVIDSLDVNAPRLAWFDQLPRLDWNLADPAELLEYLRCGRNTAVGFSFISVLIFRRLPWLEAVAERAEVFSAGSWPHIATALGYIKCHGLLRVIPEPLVNYHCSTWSWGEPIWERAMLDLKGLMELADAFFPDQPGLWDAYMGNLRKNHGEGWIAHHRIGAPDQASWETSRTLLLRAGFNPVTVAAVDLAGRVLSMKTTAWRGLDPQGLVLADLGFVLRGARRALVLAGRMEKGSLDRFLTALRTESRAELLTLGWEQDFTAGTEGTGLLGLDLARFSNDPAYETETCDALRAFAPDLLINLDPDRHPGWDLIAAAAGGLTRVAYQAPARDVPPATAAWLDSHYTHLLPAGPLGSVASLLGLRLADPPSPARAPLPVRWEGSVFVYHSLAHVNRQLALGLLASGAVDLSLIPYERDRFDGAASPFRSLVPHVGMPLPGPAAVHVRHHWPPSFVPPPEGAWVMIQPWEFGGLPEPWVGPMRDLVDEIWVPSPWVKDCYVMSGIPEDRVVVVPNGVDASVFTPEGERFPLRTTKACRFLFLGGTIHRKGIDLLLAAYLKTFRAQDDVCLVIKGQEGGVYRGSSLAETLRRVREEDPQAPEIEYLACDLDEAQVAALYRSCQVLVSPYRGEGFGLPMAEAMASGLPVIATARGGAQDFLHEDWAYLLPSQQVTLNRVDDLEPCAAGYWLEEPALECLAASMARAQAQPAERQAKGDRARSFALRELGWERPVAQVAERLAVLASRTPRRFLPQTPEAPVREALLFRTDWTRAEWVEVLLSHVQAFRPGEPVALVLAWEGPAPSVEEATDRVRRLLQSAGRETFPDLVLAESTESLARTLADYARVQEVPQGSGNVQGLQGPFGLRLAHARHLLSRT